MATLTFTVDDAVEALGFGRFQIILTCFAGLAWMAEAMELMLLSVVNPALVCEWNINKEQQMLTTMCVFAGMLVSSTFWGSLCDRFGRKRGLLTATLFCCVMGVVSGMAPNFTFFLIARTLVGFGIGGGPQVFVFLCSAFGRSVSITLYAEFLPSAHRGKCIVLVMSFWTVGACSVTLLAFLVMESHGWRVLVCLSSLPLGVFTFAGLWLPESARFHMATGKPKKALATLQLVAKKNGKQLPPGVLVTSKNDPTASSSSSGAFWALLGSQFRTTTLLLWVIWISMVFTFYGIVLFTPVLLQSNDKCQGGVTNSSHTVACTSNSDLYFDLFISSLGEIPGFVVTALIIERTGRKKCLAFEFAGFAVSTLLLLFCLPRTAVVALVFIARAFIGAASQALYIYTPEVYPTTMRASGLGAASGIARLGAMITPVFANLLVDYYLMLPVWIYGAAAIVAVVASLSLPIETKGRQMQELPITTIQLAQFFISLFAVAAVMNARIYGVYSLPFQL